MRVVRASYALLAAAAALIASGCASSGAAESSTSVEARAAVWVGAAEIARGLGLSSSVAGSKATLESAAGPRILVFAGTLVASVHGKTVDLAAPADLRGGDVFVSPGDAERIRSVWSAESAWARNSGGPAIYIPPPPGPAAPRAPVLDRPAAPIAGDNVPTAVERSAWSVPLRRDWKHIVIHHSASAFGSASQIDKWHRDKGWDGLGYDFVIGNGTGSADGQVEVGYRWRQQLVGAHAQTPGPSNYMNEHGIGIVLVGDFNRTKPTALQMRSLERLAEFLIGYCRIPQSQVLLHEDVKGTECPGRHFPRSFAVRSASAARTASAAAPTIDRGVAR